MASRSLKIGVGVALASLALAGFLLWPLGARVADDARPPRKSNTIDLSAYSDSPMPQEKSPISVAFIHHSIGGQWLAPPGPEKGGNCLYESHPNGGGLRVLLEQAGYRVYEASYGSGLGEHTDLLDWPPKFAQEMDKILRLKRQDTLHADGTVNRIVMFKSCFPNSLFVGEGVEPGNAAGPELTVANAKAAMRQVLVSLKKYPDVLFVYVTAPPAAPRLPSEPVWKWLLKKGLGRGMSVETLRESGLLARKFNDWIKSPDGFLSGYDLKNVAVFDYYDVLTQYGESDLSRYATGGGEDSHPSSEGNQKAAAEFVPFLNRAARRAGIF